MCTAVGFLASDVIATFNDVHLWTGLGHVGGLVGRHCSGSDSSAGGAKKNTRGGRTTRPVRASVGRARSGEWVSPAGRRARSIGRVG